ncbi:HvfC/BufC N-terminal domain-containing protein [Pseudomonas vanderleydeniana]|uniref:DNA-binding domain-containing protein n=1 Tax=Pseudomonas vanderleydeniana TaxID=2745495 RepID=A0A9E6PGR6_9PSED|nr:DNA-binding domain-containing protein [Pseudomonas vanderleydeniana]QXI26102.1 DNA-binding domain-containing protein [Pseudomonas vanderleydeniana]
MNDLARFQDDFIAALYQRPAPALAALTAQPGFAVYRNTVRTACIDALCDNFPSVLTLVGESWMRGAADTYTQTQPPTDARLALYGHGFPDFLAEHPGVQALPYLPGVAQLDRLWLEAFCSTVEPALAPAALACIAPEALGAQVLRPRASVRWQWCAEHPVHALWCCSRFEGIARQPDAWRGEGTLLVGELEGVTHAPLSVGAVAFLDACANGLSLDAASALAQQREPDLDFTTLFGTLMAAQVFTPLPCE